MFTKQKKLSGRFAACLHSGLALAPWVLAVNIAVAAEPPATVQGRVIWTEAPAGPSQRVTVTVDQQVCPRGWPRRRVLSGTETVEGVVVWSDAALETQVKAPLIARRDCVFAPRILAVGPEHPLVFQNQDPVRTSIRVLEPGGRCTATTHVLGRSAAIELTKLEALGHYRLEVYEGPPWMNAHVWVHPNRGFTQTSSTGSFTLAVRPGEQTVQAWHPDLGRTQLQVVVPDEGMELRLEF